MFHVCLNIVLNLFLIFFIYRSVSIPSVNRAVAKVKEGGQTTRSRSHSDKTPLGSDFPRQVKTEILKEVTQEPKLALIFSKQSQEICKPKKNTNSEKGKEISQTPS